VEKSLNDDWWVRGASDMDFENGRNKARNASNILPLHLCIDLIRRQ